MIVSWFFCWNILKSCFDWLFLWMFICSYFIFWSGDGRHRYRSLWRMDSFGTTDFKRAGAPGRQLQTNDDFSWCRSEMMLIDYCKQGFPTRLDGDFQSPWAWGDTNCSFGKTYPKHCIKMHCWYLLIPSWICYLNITNINTNANANTITYFMSTLD